MIANHKRIKRLMREHDLLIFPGLAKSGVLSGPHQLGVADLTYGSINSGFAYVAIILDAWSCKVAGYAIGQPIDARLAIAALKTAFASRRPHPAWFIIRTVDRNMRLPCTGKS